MNKTNVSINDLLKMKIDKSIIDNDIILNEMKEYNINNFIIPLENISKNDITNDLNDCNNWNMKNMITFVDSELSKIKKDYLWNIKNNILKYDKNNSLIIKNEISNILNEFKISLEQLYFNIKSEYNNVILYFEANYKHIIRCYKKLKNNNLLEYKDELYKLLNDVKTFNNDIYEMFGIYLIFDFIKNAWTIIKNIFGCKNNIFNDIINKSNFIKIILLDLNLDKSIKINNYITNILLLIESLGKILAIASAIIDITKANQKNIENTLNDNINNIKVENDKLNNNVLDLSELEKHLNDNNIILNDKNDKNLISICPIYDDNNSNIISNFNNGYIIEFSKDIKNFKINVKLNEYITLNKIIGYINNIPIKSKIKGTIKYILDRYIIIENDKIDTVNINSLLELDSNIQNEITEISNKLSNMNNIEILIKDYFNLIYKPIIYGKSINDTKSSNINNFSKIYNDIVNTHVKLKNKLEDDIKSICSVDNIKIYAESNNLTFIKNEILNKKYTFIDSIFNNISQHYNKKYYISNENDDYKMCDYYLNFMLIEHNDNIYYNKLFTIIKNFYINRYYIENKNKSELIKKFNNYLKNDNLNKTYNIIKNNIINTNIKAQLNELYPISIENRELKINTLINLYNLINDIDNIKNVNNNTSLKKITQNECLILLNFISELKNEYNSCKNVINDIENIYNEINWPQETNIYINNLKYSHYLFNNTIKLYNDVDINDYNDITSGISEYQTNSINYWQKYCANATLLNCALPTYWSTGLILLGVPILMPIILIPIKYIDGPVANVIGLGICGISISPMVLSINMTNMTGASIYAINTILESAKNMLINFKDYQYKNISIICEKLILSLNDKIKYTENEIQNINKQIELFKNL